MAEYASLFRPTIQTRFTVRLKWPFPRPGHVRQSRGAESGLGMAVGHRVAARSILDAAEHGAML
jgi:hypothetical protein